MSALISPTDPARELLIDREVWALRMLMGVRVVLVVIMLPLAWVLGTALFDQIMTSALLLSYAVWVVVVRVYVRRRVCLTAVGLSGVLLDMLLLAALPVIWHTALEQAGQVPPGMLLKSSIIPIAFLLMALNTLALRPLYPALVCAGALCVYGTLTVLAASDPQSAFTSSYLADYTSSAIAPGRLVTRFITIALVGLILTLLTITTRRMVIEAVQLEKANVQLGRYFSPNLVPRLVDNPQLFEVGGERRDLSFVFTDLQGFTALVERLDPKLAVPLINRYLNALVEVAFRHEGTVDKIVGDAVHIIFGAPAEQPDHAARAVACALEMDEVAERLRQEVAPEVTLGVTRIGVNSGVAVVGNFGGDALFDYTAHGDAINTAARLEGANKLLGTRICVSVETVKRIPGFIGRPIGALELAGRSAALAAFEPLTPEMAASAWIKAYGQAFEQLATDADGAICAFEALHRQYPNDSVAALHLQRLRDGQRGVCVAIG